MADRLKDDEDVKLESLFRSQPVQDAGFSVKVVSRVRRRIWVLRLAMPVAITIGTLIAAKPLLQLASAIPKLLMIVPDNMGSLNTLGGSLNTLGLSSLPQNSTVIFGAMLLFAVMMVGKMLED
jgi:hypothetical protein